METLDRPALGVNVGLGTLYHAHTDEFSVESGLSTPVHEKGREVSWQKGNIAVLCNNNNLAAKFMTLNLPPSLAASCLAGFVNYVGSGVFLETSRATSVEGDIYHALHFRTTTIKSSLNLAGMELMDRLTEIDPEATHMVTQVLYGGSCTITATGSAHDAARRAELVRKYEEASRILQLSGPQDLDLDTLSKVVDLILDSQLAITCFSDLSLNGHGRTTAVQIKQHLGMMFALSERKTSDTARSLSYVLTPIHELSVARIRPQVVGQLHQKDFGTIVDLKTAFRHTRSSLERHLRRLRLNQTFVRAQDSLDCHRAIEDLNTAESNFDSGFSQLLTAVRNQTADDMEVKKFIDEFTRGQSSPKRHLSVVARSSNKLNLVDHLRMKGAICIIIQDIPKHTHSARYMFYFSETAMGHASWKQNLDLAMQILGNGSLRLVAIDCDTGGPPLTKSRVSQLANGNVVVEDMIERREVEASLSFIRFDPGTTDASIKDLPAQHKSVKIRCPGGADCDGATRDWQCQKCRMKVEYGVVDGFFYCDCGRTLVNCATFNCQQDHGESYTRFKSKDLLGLLQRLPATPEINILILGETGVGKSTFINAFINYLSFETLNEALAAKDLNYIIPCSFSTQTVLGNGDLVQKEVKIGYDKDELDGSKGSSATQDSSVYLIDYTGHRVRLIDTPGIGDTRGKDMDEQNLMKILRVLRNYDKLHGILILLKPNSPRLTILFKYCVQELLTQLHKSAAQNIVFGFTNTRGSNYQPGDTFVPLQTLLKRHEDIIPGLTSKTVYCFDSESFRYLAARHKGVDMGHIDDYRNSWNHSAATARRMVDYFQDRTPHEVRNTVSLNETRYLIAQLIGPMARITSAIADTVLKGERQIHDLQNTQLKGKKLAAKLTTTKIILDSKPLDKPMTVCANTKCCSYSSDQSSEGGTVTLFKSKCHDPCSLSDVPPDVVGATQIPPCAAFDGHEDCQICGHHWKEHQHIMIEYSERIETSTDPVVQRELHSNQDEASAKKAQIAAVKKLNKELLDEHHMIVKSQARFRCYLDQHGITLYNDATIEYYELLIKDEKAKVSQGGNRARLEQMENDKATYQSFVTAMKSGKQDAQDRPLDADGVYALIKKLYKMHHYGSNLKDCAKKTGEAYAATYRERSYRIRTGGRQAGSAQRYSQNYPAMQSTQATLTKAAIQSFFIPRREVSSAQTHGQPKHNMALDHFRDSSASEHNSDHKSPASQYQDSGYGHPPPASRNFPSNDRDDFAFDDNDRDSDFTPLRPVEFNHQPPAYSPVRNELLDDDLTVAHPDPQRGQGQAGFQPMQNQPGTRGGYGNPQPVMFVSGDPSAPFGATTSTGSKNKWFSSVKDKLRGKK